MSDAGDTVRIGLVGYGFGARYFHAPLIASASGCELTAVVTRSAQRRAEVSREHPEAECVDDLTALPALGVRAVSISTPAATHAPLALEALALGLAVCVDKPFAMDPAEAESVLGEARRRNLALTVYQNRRWDSDFLTVRGLVEGGRLGRVHRVESRFERFTPDTGPGAAGGGTILDFGSHLADQALQLSGPVETVYAEARPRPDRDGLDDDVLISLRHENGVITTLFGSFVQAAPGPRWRIAGDRAAFVLDAMDGQEAALVAGRSPATEGDKWGATPRQEWGTLRSPDGEEPVPSERGRWDVFYPRFADAVRGRGEVPVDPAGSLAAMRVLEAAARSARERSVVRMGADS